jgi:hypothetical protein
MRTTWVLASLCVATTAHAGTRIVLMTDADDATALQVALAGRGTEISTFPAPEGVLRLDRAAFVQRSTVDARAVAGVWIEQELGSAEVCVLSADGKVFRHAPLPIEAGSPRVFAAIATSLLDEILSPQDEMPAINVDVHVDITPPTASGPAVAVVEPMPRPHALVAPGLAVVAPAVDGVVRGNRIQFELGPMLSPLTLGVEVEATIPILDHLRLGALGGVDVLFTEPARALFIGAAELRYVGSGTKHTDVGLIGGAAAVDGALSPFIGLRFQRVWERAESGLSLSINPVLAVVDTVGPKVYPGIWTSLRWELPI